MYFGLKISISALLRGWRPGLYLFAGGAVLGWHSVLVVFTKHNLENHSLIFQTLKVFLGIQKFFYYLGEMLIYYHHHFGGLKTFSPYTPLPYDPLHCKKPRKTHKKPHNKQKTE